MPQALWRMTKKSVRQISMPEMKYGVFICIRYIRDKFVSYRAP